MLPLTAAVVVLALSLVAVDALPSGQKTRGSTIHLTRRKGSKSHAKRADKNPVPLVDLKRDSQYFGSITAGTPPQPYNIVLDTGSADLWLASPSCNEVGCTTITARYDPSKSSSAKSTGGNFTIQYGSAAAVGDIVTDTVTMGDFTIPNQVVGVVTSLTTTAPFDDTSGILGLGWDANAETKTIPFVESLAANNKLNEPLMAFYLTRHTNDKNAGKEEPGGQFNIGYLNETLYDGDIEYWGKQDIPEWTIPLVKVTVGNTTISGPNTFALFDTGTTALLGPTDLVNQLYAAIPGATAGTGDLAGQFLVPCKGIPKISFNFGGKDWPMSEDDFNDGATGQGDMCVGAIGTTTSSPTEGAQWILGDVFLKNVYSVYRYSPPSIGIAALAAGLDTSTGGAEPTISGSVPTGLPVPSGPTRTKSAGGSTSTGSPNGATKVSALGSGALGGIAVLMAFFL